MKLIHACRRSVFQPIYDLFGSDARLLLRADPELRRRDRAVDAS